MAAKKTPTKPKLKPFKFLVQAVVIEVDGTGAVLGERPGQLLTFYGVKQLEEWAGNFEKALAEAVIEETPPPVAG